MTVQESTFVADIVDNLGVEAQYDKKVKEVLSCKPILSRIFARVMPEFSGFSIEAIESAIEGTIEVSSKPVNPSEYDKIDGSSNEGALFGEGIIYYDIVTHVILPNEGMTKVIINVEGQKTDEPGYDLVTRAIFYCARLISQQLGREFDNKNSDDKKYDNIKKVYSIWICMNAEQNQADSIVEYRIQPKTLHFGEHDRRYQPKKHRYDLMSAVMVYLNYANWKSSDNLVEMLSILLGKLDIDTKKTKLQEDYGIKMVEKLERIVNDMCNLGEGLVEETRAEITREHIIGMIKEGLNIDIIARIVKMSVEDVTSIGKKAALL